MNERGFRNDGAARFRAVWLVPPRYGSAMTNATVLGGTYDPAGFDAGTVLERTGWHLEARGACRGDVCVPLAPGVADDPVTLAEALGVGLAHDERHGLWAIGPEARARTITDVTLPDLELPTRTGAPFPLRSLIGRRGLLVAWASW